jgi:hypothetical protein
MAEVDAALAVAEQLELPHYSFRIMGSAFISLPGIFSVKLHWPLPLLLAAASVLAYVALVYPQPAPTSRAAAKRHYAQLCVYSAATFAAFTAYMALTPEEHSLVGFACHPTPTWVRAMSLVILASKVWEWRDTLILRGDKSLYDIGFLHIFHHATTTLVWLTGLNFPSGEKVGYLNAFIHALMYYHFAFKLPKFMRPVITTLQIIQFFTAFAVYAYGIYMPCNQDKGGAVEMYLPLLLVGTYLVYFIRFFISTYIISTMPSNKRGD